MKIIGVIPARFNSSRFPGKPLVKILGIPMIIRVCKIVEEALGKENTIVATDDFNIKELVSGYGYNVIMTSKNCLTGTDRVWEVAQKIKADIYVNVQGDEPMLNPNDITNFVKVKVDYPEYVINGMTLLTEQENVHSTNIPKVLVNNSNELIYMSRAAIPSKKDGDDRAPKYKKQVCIYAFSYDDLQKFGNCKSKAYYEQFEDIEILRFFDLGIPIKMVHTKKSSLAVDAKEDIKIVEYALLNEKNDD